MNNKTLDLRAQGIRKPRESGRISLRGCYKRFAMTQDFKEQLKEQVAFLESSCQAYDAGNESEAKRLAVNLRILVHDTRSSVSLLTHLSVKDQLPFVDTASPDAPPEAIVFFDGGLCNIRKTLGGDSDTRFVPVLDFDPERNAQPRQCFEDWWETPALNDQEGNSFTRKDLVRAVADQDGGAHIDAQLEATYAALTRGNSMRLATDREKTDDGWETVLSGTFGGDPIQTEPPTQGEPIGNSIALASIRQIAYEMLNSLGVVEWDEFGGAGVSNPICQQPFLTTDASALRASTGRNDPCPCNSRRKFKHCFLAKNPRAVRC